MKILIGIDGSYGAFAAARQAGHLLTPGTDEVGFFFSPPAIQIGDHSPRHEEFVARARQGLAEAVIAEAYEALSEVVRADVHSIVSKKKPAEGLLTAAEEWEADMVVVGARGDGPIQKRTLGSVTTAVVHAARLPVLVVRPPEQRHNTSSMRLLLACDGSPSSRGAGELLNRLSFPTGSKGRVISVMESIFKGELPSWLNDAALHSEDEKLAKDWVIGHEAEKEVKAVEAQSLCQNLAVPFHNSEPIIVEGHPGEEILKAAAIESTDLIAMGARGIGMLGRLLLGSTSEQVVRHASCSVLVVPMPH